MRATQARADLIADFGFTTLTNGNLKASVHSIVNFDTVFAPGKYGYVCVVTNTSSAAIEHFGVYRGALASMDDHLSCLAITAPMTLGVLRRRQRAMTRCLTPATPATSPARGHQVVTQTAVEGRIRTLCLPQV